MKLEFDVNVIIKSNNILLINYFCIHTLYNRHLILVIEPEFFVDDHRLLRS